MSAAIVYHPSQLSPDEHIFDTTPAFQSAVLKTTSAIVLFVVTYVVLLVLAIGLAVLCGYLGIALITIYVNIITIMCGLGLIGLGVMVIYFLLKFIFTNSKVDTSGFIEVTENEQPELFAFVRRISEETRSQFPKKIYLSDDVNAAVFYDSNFWSMFFPIKKNLRIGLGLVNVINVSELKAVIAHEFGHFSQRSMTFGVYVYNVNSIIYKMLYDNQSYTDVLNSWARLSKYFYLFAVITGHINSGIQAILRQVYIVINKAYSSLSIEMEYNADAVSAFVSGSDHLVTSLKKLNIGQVCYTNVLNYCNSNVAANLRSANFYPQQRILLKRFAEDHQIPMKGDELELPMEDVIFLNQSRITVKDQWASHPSISDRERKLKSLNLKTDTIADSAWVLFADASKLQVEMTDKLYQNVVFKASPQMIDLQKFTDEFNDLVGAKRFDERYKGYYDNRDIKAFDTAEVIKADKGIYTFDDLFTSVNCKLATKISDLKTDIETLKAIGNKANNIKSFDFDGAKYSYKQAPFIELQLEAEVVQTENELQELDKKVFAYFYHSTKLTRKQNELDQLYQELFAVENETEQDLKLYNDTMAAMQPIYGKHHYTKIFTIVDSVMLCEEKIIPRIQYVAEKAELFGLHDEQLKCLDEYLKSKKVYFTRPNFDNRAIAIFNRAMHTFAAIVSERNFETKKKLLNAQIKLNSD